MLFQIFLSFQTLLNHFSFSSGKGESNKLRRSYNLSKYELPYSPTELHQILTVLNQSSVDDFHCFKITKGIATKLIRSRNYLGHFKNVDQLLDIEGFGIKKVKQICDNLLMDRKEHDNTDDKIISRNVIDERRLIKPKVPEGLKKVSKYYYVLMIVSPLGGAFLLYLTR